MSNFNKLKGKLTQNEIDEIVNAISYNCQYRIKEMLKRKITFFWQKIPYDDIFNNVVKTNKGWECVTQNPFYLVKMRKIIKDTF